MSLRIKYSDRKGLFIYPDFQEGSRWHNRDKINIKYGDPERSMQHIENFRMLLTQTSYPPPTPRNAHTHLPSQDLFNKCSISVFVCMGKILWPRGLLIYTVYYTPALLFIKSNWVVHLMPIEILMRLLYAKLVCVLNKYFNQAIQLFRSAFSVR